MKINIIAVGKPGDGYKQLCDEYVKRLGRFCHVCVHEIKEGEDLVKRQGEQILAKLGRGAAIAMCIDGDAMSSKELAACIEQYMVNGCSELSFIIGGSCGLSDEVIAAANKRISMSKMTFPHILARVMLLEQLYRAFKINANQTYHK